ncbi:MAG: hypothetical protein SGJ27_27980 [Candidatus Melainabacteria bacterium]|nr:hypothetical protein [Candidatus Melainabacteria bacterium]
MSTTNTTPKNATRDARLAECRTKADQIAVEELGAETNREVTVTSSVTTAVKTGTKTKSTEVSATSGLKVSESEVDEAAATK